MTQQSPEFDIKPASGKLGVLIPGLGAVASTFIAGAIAVNKNLGKPIGSLTQMGRIRLGSRKEKRFELVKDFVPLSGLDDLVFGGWDVYDSSLFDQCLKSNVLDGRLLYEVKDELESIRPMPAVFDQKFVKNIDPAVQKTADTKWDMAQQLIADMEQFQLQYRLDRLVVIWCGSTEIFMDAEDVPNSLESFEAGLKSNHPGISPSMIYAYAAVKLGVPYANGAPNLALELPAIQELAAQTGTPIAGKDFKTGQTLMKTILAPGLKARQLGLDGWFSTNILGNLDGKVLDDPDAFKTKETTKLSVLDTILQPDLYPDLYKDYYHKVRINYYPPRGDNKEGWDNIDIFGWLGYPMQIKVDFLCRDSILAAPLVLDLALFLDFAKRAGLSGIQEWLSFYFKSPMTLPELYPEHDVFIQLKKLKNTLRYLMGEELITHLGADYYGF